MKWLTVFLITIVYDWVWAKYNIACSGRKAIHASVYSGLLFALGGFVIVEYTRDPILLTAAVSGAVIGTLIAVR